DADQRVRENATEALILIGAPAVEPLTALLAGNQAEAKKYALVALAKIGPPAKTALPAIQKLSQDPDEAVKKLAAEALKRSGPGPSRSARRAPPARRSQPSAVALLAAPRMTRPVRPSLQHRLRADEPSVPALPPAAGRRQCGPSFADRRLRYWRGGRRGLI